MKKFLIMAVAAASLTSTPMITSHGTQAEARTTTPGRLAGEGRRECRAIPTGWKAIVRGIEYLGGPPNHRFSLRYCFRSQAECAQFVNSIERIIYPLEAVTYRKCRPY